MRTFDAQQALGFLVEQAAHIESEVYRIQYPDIQYPALIPVDTSANEWAKTITFFSMDKFGAATWLNHLARDIPVADVNRTKHEASIEMAGIGYRYTLEELGHAMLVPQGASLSADRAEAARRASEEFIDNLALRGDTSKNLTGLINDANVTVVNAAFGGTGNSPEWDDKTADQILADINDLLTGIHTSSLQIELADTLLVPVVTFALLTSKRVGDTNMTVMQYLMLNNIYTAITGAQLTVRAVRGLETAGVASSGRVVAYKRDPRVLKLHLPMPHRFLPVWQTGPMLFDVPGIFRTGGIEIRRPGAVRYMDRILDPNYV